MKSKLLLVFLLISVAAFSQSKIDTVRCGDFVGYGKIVNGKKEGKWVYYFVDSYHGDPLFKGTYHQGQKIGEWVYTTWDTKRIVHYQNNILNGPIIVYKIFNKGKLQFQCKGTYFNGTKSGKWVYHDTWVYSYSEDDTTISRIAYYENDFPTGIWTIFLSPHESWSGPMNASGNNGYWIHHDTLYNEDPNHPGIFILKKIILDSM